MNVRIAHTRGFCFGVEDAIEIAEHAVEERGPGQIVALGPVIHNKQVVGRLEEAGLNQSGDLDAIAEGSTILIRSHGAGPDTFEKAREKNLNVVDATCVLVKQAQNVVRELHEEGYQVVMIGDADHPEVKGVIGYAPNVIVVDSAEEVAERLPYKQRLGVVAQTTHAPEHVAEVIASIVRRPYRELKIVNTLCLEVVRRQEAAVELAREVDVMFVLGGLHSANTRELAHLCKQEGVDTYHLEGWDDFKPEMARTKTAAGITAGASTPEWIIEEFVKNLESFDSGA